MNIGILAESGPTGVQIQTDGVGTGLNRARDHGITPRLLIRNSRGFR